MKEVATNVGARPVRKKGLWKNFRDNAELSLMALPGILALLIFSYIPMAGVIVAFKDYRNNLGILECGITFAEGITPECRLKVMVWNDMTSMMPIMEAKDFFNRQR